MIYKIEISFPESLRNIVKEKLKELKEIIEYYHQLRDYNKESFGVN